MPIDVKQICNNVFTSCSYVMSRVCLSAELLMTDDDVKYIVYLREYPFMKGR